MPKSKFAFKRRPSAAVATNPTSEPSSTQIPPPPLQAQNAPPSSAASTNLSLSSHSHRYLTREALPSHPAQSDLSISDLDHCIVNLLPSASSSSSSSSGIDTPLIISALHARNLSDCVVLLPGVDGSALLHDLERCVVVLGCHQVRFELFKPLCVFLPYLALLSLGCMPRARSTCTFSSRLIPSSSIARRSGFSRIQGPLRRRRPRKRCELL